MSIRSRLAITLIATFAALFFLAPTVKKDLPEWWSKYEVNLGLDLQGGMHLVLGVDQDEAVKGALERLADEVKDSLSDKHIRLKRIKVTGKDRLSAALISERDAKETEGILVKEFPQLEISMSGGEITLILKKEEVDFIKKFAVDQGIETIRNRVDEFGVSEPTIQKQGDDRILVQLPGIKDPDRAIELIGKTAQLQFKIVDDEHDLDEAIKGRAPRGSEVLYKKVTEKGTGRVISNTPFLLKSRVLMTGDRLTNARVRIDSQFNQPYITISFDSKGGKQFERLTGANIGKRLAIVLDDNVYSAPVIKSKISGGSAIVEGSFTMEEARDLAIVLRAGALPAPVEILENRTVGPSLGKDSIDKGVMSMLIGGALVIIFMTIYYKMAGFVADIVLTLNIMLVVAFLASINATLTLPGIAGIVLTIGMAVDANVIIFERIREELRVGKTPYAALDSGYSKAFRPIMDANITTLIAALVLFEFGTGPVKGFAVTLSIGIVMSLFTALFVSRLIFDLFLLGRKSHSLSI